MYVVVLRLDQIMAMNIVNLAFQVIVGIVVYVVCLIIFRAPIIDQAKGILGKGEK